MSTNSSNKIPKKKQNTQKLSRNLSVFVSLLLPVLLLSAYSYYTTRKNLTDVALSRRQEIVNLTGQLIKERLDRVIDVGISFSTRVTFRRLIEENKWTEAVALFDSAPRDFSYIARLSFFDANGVLKGTTDPTPEIKSAIGKSFTYRDYYQGVAATHKPYVGEAIVPAVPLGYNLIPISIPVISDKGEFIGFILINVRLDTILTWSAGIDTGSGIIYVTDSHGKLIAHPTLPLQSDKLVDFSEVPPVQKALKGETGVGIFYNPVEKVERLGAYYRVPDYGWAVVFAESLETAFGDRDSALNSLLILLLFINFGAILSAYLIVRSGNKLLEAKAKDDAVLNSIGEGLVITDRDGRITMVNPVFENMFKVSKSDVMGKKMSEVILMVDEAGRVIPEAERPITQTLHGDKLETKNMIRQYKRSDGTLFPSSLAISPIVSENRVIGAVEVTRDVTREREIDKAKTEFVSLASHQLRTPLSTINWYTEMLLAGDAGKVTDEQKKYLDEIYTGNQRMVELVNALLNVSRLELGTLVVEPEQTDVIALAKAEVDEQMQDIKKRGMTLKTEFAKNVPLLMTDPKLLRMIFQNLISNSVKYTPNGGTITVKIDSSAKEVVISVSDTGYGIPKHQHDKVFNKLFRADNVKEMDTEGTGLGLYIIKSIVERMRGKIRFESEENKGTTFFITLPVKNMDRNVKK